MTLWKSNIIYIEQVILFTVLFVKSATTEIADSWAFSTQTWYLFPVKIHNCEQSVPFLLPTLVSSINSMASEACTFFMVESYQCGTTYHHMLHLSKTWNKNLALKNMFVFDNLPSCCNDLIGCVDVKLNKENLCHFWT